MEHSRILERLIFPLRHTEQDNLGGFPKIVARRTNQIADIFNEEEARAAKPQLDQMAIHHARVQVTGAARNNLPNRKAVARQPTRIVVDLEIARKNGHGGVLGERRQRFFQKCGLAGFPVTSTTSDFPPCKCNFPQRSPGTCELYHMIFSPDMAG